MASRPRPLAPLSGSAKLGLVAEILRVYVVVRWRMRDRDIRTTVARLRSYPWPGNVRELQNAIERAAILSNGSEIEVPGLQLPAARPSRDQMPEGLVRDEFVWDGPLEEVAQRAVAHVEKFKIENALRESKWNKTRAAEKLGVSYKTLQHKIRALNLEN